MEVARSRVLEGFGGGACGGEGMARVDGTGWWKLGVVMEVRGMEAW